MASPLPDAIDYEVIKVLATVAMPLISVAGLGWKLQGWMRDQFDKVEKEQQERHEANLSQFNRIFVALAELGWRNGTPRGTSK